MFACSVEIKTGDWHEHIVTLSLARSNGGCKGVIILSSIGESGSMKTAEVDWVPASNHETSPAAATGTVAWRSISPGTTEKEMRM